MSIAQSVFNETLVLHQLKQYLPAQAPLKDFIHHNTLHGFQHHTFHHALHRASEIFGYKTTYTITEFRELFAAGRIKNGALEKVILDRKGPKGLKEWREKALIKTYITPERMRIGMLRINWKKKYKTDMDSLVHPVFFRVLSAYLDQGISIWNFPVHKNGFLESIREIEKNSYAGFFKNKRVRKLLLSGSCDITSLLTILVGDPTYFSEYLFDLQFAHQGWSGLVATIENNPDTLLDKRNISLHDIVVFELLLEIDALDNVLGKSWDPLCKKLTGVSTDIFSEVPETELHDVLSIWQDAFELTYYDTVLSALLTHESPPPRSSEKSFQALFCIDDRECSVRRYIEKQDENCETFGTPGFFHVEFYYQPQGGKFYTKLCPAPITPKYLVKEINASGRRTKDLHFSKHSHSFFAGWLISQTLGFWSAFRLFLSIFRPRLSPATAYSFRHMDAFSKLTIENASPQHSENGLQIGFTIEEMADRVENLLRSIGLTQHFAPLVYAIGHGSSSVNNPHYAAYDCGACSGRAGSVNARAFCSMANHAGVRLLLEQRGIHIPPTTQFIGGLHDTTRDEISFYDEDILSEENAYTHDHNYTLFKRALHFNAKERSRRLETAHTQNTPDVVHKQMKKRSVSLFEPRPELNHATNSLCIIGRRGLTKNLFLDRRAFMNSYDYAQDPVGKYLLGVLKPIGPVCGGINLEYFFSRTDNNKLGAGSKLPHNVIGLIGVANGTDGDLRPGLPSQMIELHDPVRLLVVVEHFPEVVLQTIQKAPEVYEWYKNEWINLVVIEPTTKKLYWFRNEVFIPYNPLNSDTKVVSDLTLLVENYSESLPVCILQD